MIRKSVLAAVALAMLTLAAPASATDTLDDDNCFREIQFPFPLPTAPITYGDANVSVTTLRANMENGWIEVTCMSGPGVKTDGKAIEDYRQAPPPRAGIPNEKKVLNIHGVTTVLQFFEGRYILLFGKQFYKGRTIEISAQTRADRAQPVDFIATFMERFVKKPVMNK